MARQPAEQMQPGRVGRLRCVRSSSSLALACTRAHHHATACNIPCPSPQVAAQQLAFVVHVVCGHAQLLQPPAQRQEGGKVQKAGSEREGAQVQAARGARRNIGMRCCPRLD